jgi:hypothetical protein
MRRLLIAALAALLALAPAAFAQFDGNDSRPHSPQSYQSRFGQALQVNLSADQTVTSGTFANLGNLSLTLTPGTWLVRVHLQLVNNATHTMFAYIWNATDGLAVAGGAFGLNSGFNGPMHIDTIVTVSTAKTFTVQTAVDGATWTVQHTQAAGTPSRTFVTSWMEAVQIAGQRG